MTSKDNLYLDKKFLFISWLKLTLIQLVFLFFGIALSGAGHGTFIPFPIFYGLLFLPTIFELPNEFVAEQYQIIFLFVVPIIFFLFSLFLSFYAWKKLINKKILKFIITFHLVIALTIVIIFFTRNGIYSPSPVIHLIGISTSLVLSFFFWRVFFKIISHKKSMQSA